MQTKTLTLPRPSGRVETGKIDIQVPDYLKMSSKYKELAQMQRDMERLSE